MEAKKNQVSTLQPSPVEARRNLVIVRAGRNSLHPRWLQDSVDRTWDILVSYYDPAASHAHESDIAVVYHRGGKWDGIHQALDETDVLRRYEYFWLPDDDIETTSKDIDRIFAAMREFDLDVAQPALTHQSFYSHFLLMACPDFKIRYSNYIEIMVPCLSRDLLEAVYREFRGTRSGWGLDYIWCRLNPAPRKAAILDFVSVFHTRPLGLSLRKQMAQDSLCSHEEEKLLRDRYLVTGKITPLVYAAIDRRDRLVEGGGRLGLTMAYSQIRALGSFRDKRDAIKMTMRLLRRQLTRSADLTPLQRNADDGGAAGFAESDRARFPVAQAD